MAKPSDKPAGETESASENPGGGTAGKSGAAQPGAGESSAGAKEAKDSKSVEGSDAKSSDAKSSDAKSSEARPGEARSSDARSSDAKSGEGKSGEAKPGEARGGGKGKDSQDAPAFIERMKSQHKALHAILDKRSGRSAEPFAVAREFAAVWLPHNAVERDVLRGLRGADSVPEVLAEVEIRKDIVNLLLANLLDQGPRGAEKAAIETLAQEFSALVQLGRREQGGLSQAIESFLSSGRLPMPEIDKRFERARQKFGELDDDAIGEAIEELAPRRLSVHEERQQSERERYMPRYSSQGRDRDEQGRFLPEEERGYGRNGGGGGGYRSMSQRDEGGRFVGDDERRSRSMPQRDEGGRFVGDDERRSRSRHEDEDDDRGRYRQSSQRGYDEDERRSGSSSRDRGQGGWFGDQQGHSEASRRGWDNPEHGRSGWFGDREGHSEASRRGWESGSDHGRSGWYGDSEGHSQAARRGWEEGHRSQRREDDDNGRSGRRYEAGRYESQERRGSGGGSSGSGGYESRRGRSDDDDDRHGSSGHGGWSGDSEGHAEAARRGWERRR